ncbi:MAG TPA: 50S ribosomal protein L25 [Gemmataceae bacterium]|nr:50S ribosomal protein L25 [Gemmataceae bacterium]
MAESVQLAVQPREGTGSLAARRLRKQGLLPAVIYGHKEATVVVALSHDDFAKALGKGARLVELKTDGGAEAAIIQDIQWDHLGKDVLHVDFRRVSKDERVVVSVPLHLRGVAPGVSGGGLLDQPLHVIDVECLVTAVPDEIRVNIGELQQDQAIHVKDLRLPEGVKAMADPDAIVVHIRAPLAEPEAAAAPAAETAEPEVIGRQAKPEEGEEEK